MNDPDLGEFDEGPITLPPGAKCAGCAYSELAPLNPANVLEKTRVCRRNPPIPVLVTQQTAKGMQGSFLTLFPTVADEMVCFEFDAKEAVIPTALG